MNVSIEKKATTSRYDEYTIIMIDQRIKRQRKTEEKHTE